MTRILKTLSAASITTLLALPVLASTITEEVDADGNGTLSLQEMQVAYPDMTADAFGLIDINGDGEADADEIKAALDAGYLVTNG